MPEKVTWEQINRSGNKLLAPAYKSNGHVFTSGSVGSDPVTKEIPEDVAQQTENAILNLEHVLKHSGSSLDKVFKVLLFVSDGSFGPIVNEIYHKYFPHQPARSCIVVGFPNKKIKVELEAVAEYKELDPKL
ncbi:hypothetical protein WICMUC_001176 [Wickerhamomyces mucosus]|uniref:Uncharacterized protein n=1 Tax=Wickerhamomyces mucosus TaxID=1378264 RepID=A0A9P8PX13_9ASCO|nr:hypothetical protein WICMUC_001176 [Wickerhamomyces mucosus]